MAISQIADYTATPPPTDRVPFGARKKRPEKVACEVRIKGLEPPRLSAPDPKSGSATNYATAAEMVCKDKTIYCITKKISVFFI